VQLGSVLRGKCHVGQDIEFGFVQEGCQFGQLGTELVGHHAPLGPGACGVTLGKSRGDEGRDDMPAILARVGQDIAHEVDAATCQVGCSTLLTVALMPSWASEMTSLTPRRPRRGS